MLNLESLPSELVVAVLVALSSFLWIQSSAGMRRWYLRRKFRVHGDYLSYFEETHRNAVYWKKSVLKVRQRGLVITARSDTETSFHAEITRTRLITGTYYGRNRDSTKGTVFLESDPSAQDVYRGFYAGYDFSLRGLMRGRYVWRRLYRPHIGLISNKPSKRLQTRTFLGKYLDSRYLSATQLDSAFRPKQPSTVLVATLDGLLAGAAVVDAAPQDDLARIINHIGSSTRLQNLELQEFGLLRGVAVSADYRMRGIATALVRAAISYMRTRSCTAIMCVEWMPDREVNPVDGGRPYPPTCVDWAINPDWDENPPLAIRGTMDGLLETEGFDLLGKLRNWPRPADACVYCGPSCVCVGWVFARSLDGSTR